MTAPFNYPESPHARRHGPRGYADVAGFRPWLRDEFSFRCVYCLLREHWVPGGFHLDHFLPVARHPGLALEYDNLLYACSTCNGAKRDLELPDPTQILIEPAVTVLDDGTIQATTAEAERLIQLMDLNSSAFREFRLLWIDVLALTARSDPDLERRLLAYPDDLPNLSRLRPPGGNTRPAGASESSFAKRQRATLPRVY